MSQYANAVGISYSKAKRMKLEGRLPYLQDGRTIRIPEQALDYEWLAQWRQREKRTA